MITNNAATGMGVRRYSRVHWETGSHRFENGQETRTTIMAPGQSSPARQSSWRQMQSKFFSCCCFTHSRFWAPENRLYWPSLGCLPSHSWQSWVRGSGPFSFCKWVAGTWICSFWDPTRQRGSLSKRKSRPAGKGNKILHSSWIWKNYHPEIT